MQSRNLRRSGLAAMLGACALFASAGAAGEAWRWSGVERIVAVSDVHGAAPAMLAVLEHAGVIDEEETWIGGRTHLVVTGDLLDRGPESRRAMDVLMRLEGEAAAAGGRVHVLLGNHEAMNLVGDLRYVSAAEYAAFMDEESAEDRERAYATFAASRSGAMAEAEIRARFDALAPPGFFGHRKAFAPSGRYGRWLLDKPLLVVINETAFVHGGLSPMVAELGLDGVNGKLKSSLTAYAGHLATLTAAGILDPTENFYRHRQLLEALPPDAARPAELQRSIDETIRLADAAIHDSASPLWYRGTVGCSALVETDKLAAVLAALAARRVVIGHTPTPGRRVLERLDGRVLEIDTGMLNAAYGGRAHALVIEGDSVVVVDQDGTAHSPSPHPPVPAVGLSEDEIVRTLASGEVVSSSAAADGRSIVVIRDGEHRLQAVFREHPRRGFAPELAAWRLDRMLGLEMVPVTVEREIGGRRGSLQLLPEGVLDETARAAAGEGASAWCPLRDQWQAMYLFDTLAGNGDRAPGSMLYRQGTLQLLLSGHGKAFGTRSGRPRYLKDVDLEPGPAWVRALASLTDAQLQAELGDVLDGRRLRALYARRDALLRAAPAVAEDSAMRATPTRLR